MLIIVNQPRRILPNGETETKPGLGTRIEKFVHPIAKALGLPCLDEKQEKLRPESPCAKRRDWLDKQFPGK